MEVATYNHEDGDFLVNIVVEESDTFSMLKDKIEEEKGIDAADQTLFIRHAVAAPWSEVLEIRLQDEALNHLVRDFKECRILVYIPDAADEVQTDTSRYIIVGADNKLRMLSQGNPVKLQAPGQLNIYEKTVVENGRRFHHVLQYKDPREGKLSIKNDETSIKVFYTSKEGTEDENPLVPEIKELEERERLNWTQTGQNIRGVIGFVGEVTNDIITAGSSIVEIFTGGTAERLMAFLRIFSASNEAPPVDQ